MLSTEILTLQSNKTFIMLSKHNPTNTIFSSTTQSNHLYHVINTFPNTHPHSPNTPRSLPSIPKSFPAYPQHNKHLQAIDQQKLAPKIQLFNNHIKSINQKHTPPSQILKIQSIHNIKNSPVSNSQNSTNSQHKKTTKINQTNKSY